MIWTGGNKAAWESKAGRGFHKRSGKNDSSVYHTTDAWKVRVVEWYTTIVLF